MQLASITSREENDLIINKIKQSGKCIDTEFVIFFFFFKSVIFILHFGFNLLGFSSDFWIAAIRYKDNRFYWVSRHQEMTLHNWSQYQPSGDKSTNCVQISWRYQYGWSVNNCDYAQRFICEK